MLPSLRTITLSLSMMVLSLWAMVRTVQPTNSSLIVVWMRSSVSRSTAAVASSRMRILVLRSRALPRQTSCLCPTLRFDPPSSMVWSRPVGRAETKDRRWAWRRPFQI